MLVCSGAMARNVGFLKERTLVRILCCCVELSASSIPLQCPTSLSCLSRRLPVVSDGYLSANTLRALIAILINASQTLRRVFDWTVKCTAFEQSSGLDIAQCKNPPVANYSRGFLAQNLSIAFYGIVGAAFYSTYHQSYYLDFGYQCLLWYACRCTFYYIIYKCRYCCVVNTRSMTPIQGVWAMRTDVWRNGRHWLMLFLLLFVSVTSGAHIEGGGREAVGLVNVFWPAVLDGEIGPSITWTVA